MNDDDRGRRLPRGTTLNEVSEHRTFSLSLDNRNSCENRNTQTANYNLRRNLTYSLYHRNLRLLSRARAGGIHLEGERRRRLEEASGRVIRLGMEFQQNLSNPARLGHVDVPRRKLGKETHRPCIISFIRDCLPIEYPVHSRSCPCILFPSFTSSRSRPKAA